MQGDPYGSGRTPKDKTDTNTIIIIVVITIAFILLGMFSFTNTPQSSGGLSDGVDKYGRSTQATQ